MECNSIIGWTGWFLNKLIDGGIQVGVGYLIFCWGRQVEREKEPKLAKERILDALESIDLPSQTDQSLQTSISKIRGSLRLNSWVLSDDNKKRIKLIISPIRGNHGLESSTDKRDRKQAINDLIDYLKRDLSLD